MLTEPLAIVRAARPRMRFLPRAVVEAILLSGGSIGRAETVARNLGLDNRFTLARLLKREGLPPLHRLAEWATVLGWIESAERHGVSLCCMAFRCGRHPSACYRLVKEITGLRWDELRARGSAWARRRFLSEIEAHAP